MFWRYIYVLVIFAAVAISSGIAIFAWRQRNKTGTFLFAGMMLAVAEWLITSAMVSLSQSPEQALFWVNPRYFGLTTMLAFFITFAIQYTGHEKWLTRPRQIFFFAVPIVTQAIIETDPWHHLFLVKAVFSKDGILMGIDSVQYGPVFWLHTVYSYLLVLVGLGLIVRMSICTFHLYRAQALFMIVGALPPLITSVSDAFLLIPGLKHPLAPLGFALMGTFFAAAVFWQRMLDIVPVARDVVIESMSEAMIVLDAHANIVDVNASAQHFFGLEPSQIIGEPIGKLFPAWDGLTDQSQTQGFVQSEIDLNVSGDQKYYEVQISPLKKKSAQSKERIVILRDITQRKRVELQLQDTLNSVRSLQAQLYEQAIRDPLTNLYNRRCMDETLQREFSRAVRGAYPVSVVIMDIDHFKDINDTFGHEAGDVVLKLVAERLSRRTRENDYVFRYGGEEFMILLPGATAQAAYHYAERCRSYFHENYFEYAEHKISLTLSIGIATLTDRKETPEEIMAAADDAMYRAKSGGRNCINMRDA